MCGRSPRHSFRERIRVLEDHFQHRPLVLFFDHLVADPERFVRTIAEYVGASYAEGDISFRPTNRSYRDRQYRFLRAVGRRRGRKGRGRTGPPAIRWLRVRSLRLSWHVGLAVGRVVPRRLLSQEPLITEAQLARARAFYEADWKACLDYATMHNPTWTLMR